MAGNDSRVYRLENGISVLMLGQSIVGFLSTEKNMIAEGVETPDGYFIQAKSDSDGWTKVAGMTKAIQVQIIATGDMATVSIGQGKWSDKVGAGVAGAFIFAPLAATAVIGAVKQSKLPGEIFDHCERFLMSGGKSVRVGFTTAHKGQNANEVRCPQCGTNWPSGTRFCSECGTPLGEECPNCGKQVGKNAKFCPECGCDLHPVFKCPNCGEEVQDGQAFCASCGTKL